MIAQIESLPEPPRWQTVLAEAISRPAELLQILELAPEEMGLSADAMKRFSLRVPRGYVARMGKRDPSDPLLRQVLPVVDEEQGNPGFVMDPVADKAAERVPGVLHKYQGRVLLLTTGACGIHCRYCFRRHFSYAESNPASRGWEKAVEYIHRDSSIDEVILSGGDPLSLPDERLGGLTRQIAQSLHVKRLRVHTRMPIVLPERVNNELLDWLCGTRLIPVVVLHANHANEINQSVRLALQQLREAGLTLLNQSVLLRGVNDSVQALCDLSETLFDAGVLPYYLHLLDRVAGAAHFEVSEVTARHLWDGLRNGLPGYLVPRLVREQAGALSKEWIC